MFDLGNSEFRVIFVTQCKIYTDDRFKKSDRECMG